MIGSYKIKVANSHCEYELVIKRNLTVIRGNSGKGKTRLFNMIAEYKRLGKSSGIKLVCDTEVIAYMGDDWQEDLTKYKNKIVFIDEDNNSFIRSQDFARVIKSTDNYYVIIARDYLPELPYSIEEIYEPDNSRRKVRLKKCYKNRDYIYARNEENYGRRYKPDVVIIEDTNSGYQFFVNLFAEIECQCVSAGGRTKIFDECKKHSGKKILVIADGAAFGPEIEDICILKKKLPGEIKLFLPESFEWMLLASDIIQNVDKKVLLETWDYVESKKFFSWELFFENYIKELTKESRYMKYSKRKLSRYYLEERNVQKVKDGFKAIDF